MIQHQFLKTIFELFDSRSRLQSQVDVGMFTIHFCSSRPPHTPPEILNLKNFLIGQAYQRKLYDSNFRGGVGGAVVAKSSKEVHMLVVCSAYTCQIENMSLGSDVRT